MDTVKFEQLSLFSQTSSSLDEFEKIKSQIEGMDIDGKIDYINKIKKLVHDLSPFKNEPVDCVLWVKNDKVKANDYNPNTVAPPEMKLLETSIDHDGFTQPIVTMETDVGEIEVIDGFHRNRVGKECESVRNRILGYLPVVEIRDSQKGKSDRIASTIRHNRARGKHQINAMSDIVVELKNRNWKNSRIAKELGMDEDEVLRLCQITGLQELFKDDDFSNSWDIGGDGDEYQYLTDDVPEENDSFRTVNTSDPSRIFHTYDKWECHKAGFYATNVDGKTANECKEEYYNVLSDEKLFSETLEKIIVEWKCSCQHYLSNKAMNRISWLGQAAVCYVTGVPSKYCSGWDLLSEEQKEKANSIALKYLNIWLKENGIEEVSFEDGVSLGRQVSIY